ncbi:serine hydrolase [Actinophytocola xanthii]|uniref:Serine hydrolase n=1 Tax=Actinophytocola xanthii TaxID=1912961 RepID=A0A1Q8CXV6_9PSEU|nr:serine hydrolase [Actinophytocola xanthii]OLF19172.1 serine hydrolase [Actinophytocola xanthii]
MTRRMRIEDLPQLAVPSQPALSPDGTRVVYVLRTLDIEQDRNVDQLWLVDTAGGAPRRLTSGPADTVPSWSPDGRRLAFLRDGQVAVLDADGGEPERVTELPLGAGTPCWSPDSHRLAFAAPVDPAGGATGPMVSDGLDYQADGAGTFGAVRTQLHVLDLATRELRQLTDGPDGAGDPSWSPDGTVLAFPGRAGTDSDLRWRTPVHLLAVDDPRARPRVLAFEEGIAATVSWVADGSALLVAGWSGDPVGHTRLFRVGVDGTATGAVDDLSGATDRNVMPGAPGYPGGLPREHGDRVVFCLRDHGCTHLWSVAAGGGDARPVLNGEGRVVSGLSVAGDRAALALATPESFGEIVVVDLVNGDHTVLTDHGAALEGLRPHPREERWFTISDGTRVQAWLSHDPARSGPRPLLLDIHGGPHNAWNAAADEMHFYHQELVERGWAVLTVNPRGSDGYGEAFYDGVRDAWGVADAADFLEPLDELVAEGFADPDRLAVAGYSYGGFMTCWLTGHDDRFAAAVAGGTVSDLASMGGTSDDCHLLSAYELGATPWQDPERYAAMSPITRVADVRTPTLVIHGATDLRCPVGQAQQWHTALRERGVPTRLVVYPDASHLFILTGLPSQRLDFNRRVLDWLEQYVTRGGRPRIDAAHWQRRLSRLAERHRVPGAQLGILRLAADGADDELVEVAHGTLHVRTGAPVSTDALFQIGSITKVWTATVAMALVDDGLLGLDTPVAEVLPELRLADPDVTKAVTVRHLLNHTSGIDGDVFTDTGRGDDCLERYVEVLGDAGQNHPLGATWSYCNSGYALLGRVIEKVTGKTWDQAMRERLFTPLGLAHSVTLPEEALMFATAMGHDERAGELVPAQVWGLPRSIGPAGLVTSTVGDVLAFARMHLTGGLAADGTRVLSAESTAAMAAHEADLPDKHVLGDSWGLGWIRFGWDGRRLLGHDGNTLGQAAFLRVLPEEGIAVALLTNGGHTRDLYADLYPEIFAALAGLTMPTPFAPPAEPVAVDVAPFVGVYERAGVRTEVENGPEGPVLRTTLTGPLAELEPDPVHEYPLVPVGPALFAIRPPEAETWMAVTFYELPTGERYVHYGARATPKVS